MRAFPRQAVHILLPLQELDLMRYKLNDVTSTWVELTLSVLYWW